MSRKNKKINNKFWNEEEVSAAMREYKNAHVVTKTRIPGNQKMQIDIILNDASKHGRMQMLYREIIYPAHKKLAAAYLNYKSVNSEDREQMLYDVVTFMYETMMLYWNANAGTSTYSYFAYAVNTSIAHYFGGKLASSPEWTKEKEVKYIIREEDSNISNVDIKVENIKQSLNSTGMEDGVDYNIKVTPNGKKIKAYTTVKTTKYYMDERDDIVEDSYQDLWNQVCLKTLSEYIPDVNMPKKYQDLAYALLEIIGEIISGTYSKSSAIRIDFWLLSRVQLNVGWSVTSPDIKLSYHVVRTALKYYLEDFPLEAPPEYGESNWIRSIEELN